MKMKKLTITLIFASFFFFINNNVNAQAFEKGSIVVNLGGGFGGYLSSGVGASGSVEVGIWPTGDFGIIGLGAISGITFSSAVLILNDVNYTEFSIGPRGTYHFTIIPVENLDVYAAVQILYALQTTKYDNSLIEDVTDSNVYPGFVAGARYYFSDFFGVFAEVGYSVTYLTGGIALKF